MKSREKIVLILMAIAVLYGAYDLFFSSPIKPVTKTSEQGVEETKTFVLDMVKFLTKDDTSTIDTYIITRAASGWNRDPFLRSEQFFESKGNKESSESEAEVVSFRYTGYLETGDKKLAVINGMEYEEGENLDQAGYFLRSISKARVIVGKKGDMSNITLSLEEGSIPSLEKKKPLPVKEITINLPALKNKK